MERKWELKKDGAEFVSGAQNVEAGANSALVSSGREGSRRAGLVSEALPELGGENEARVNGNTIEPLRGVLGMQRLVKGSVDFDGVEEFGEISGLVESLGTAGWIDVAGPVWIRPPGRTDIKVTGRGSIGRGFGASCSRTIPG